MKWRLHFALILLLAGGVPRLMAGEVVDRVVAVVDGYPILATEWDDAVRYECFLNRCAPNGLTVADRKATLQRMIDQRLIEQEMKSEDPHPVQADAITK